MYVFTWKSASHRHAIVPTSESSSKISIDCGRNERNGRKVTEIKKNQRLTINFNTTL